MYPFLSLRREFTLATFAFPRLEVMGEPKCFGVGRRMVEFVRQSPDIRRLEVLSNPGERPKLVLFLV